MTRLVWGRFSFETCKIHENKCLYSKGGKSRQEVPRKIGIYKPLTQNSPWGPRGPYFPHVIHFHGTRATLACLYRTSGRFHRLQLKSVDYGLFMSHPHRSIMKGCGLVMVPIVIQFGNGQILIESALHSLYSFKGI